jgi:uncharacterized membrane protein YfcA
MTAILLGTVVGLVLALTGAAGSISAVPLLVFGLGLNMTQATPVALVAVCGAALVGTASAWKAGRVCQHAAIIIGVFGSVTAPLGIVLAARASRSTLALSFAAVMAIVAVRMALQARARPFETRVAWTNATQDDLPGAPLCRVDTISRRIRLTSPCALVLAFSGSVTGILSGALGVGAGFIIVPTLRASSALSIGSSIATSLMAMAIISASGVLGLLVRGDSLPFAVAAPFLAGALGGMVIGRWIAPLISGPRLQQTFAAFMIVAAASVIWRALATPR